MRTTLAFCVLLALAGSARAHFIWLVLDGEAGQDKQAEDPAATKLLADARAARAVWKDFPGFSADITVNQDGKLHKGTVEVAGTGKASVTLDAHDDLKTAIRREIVSLVMHRMPGPESQK